MVGEIVFIVLLKQLFAMNIIALHSIDNVGVAKVFEVSGRQNIGYL
jgi:hypothetical protein